MSHCDGEYHVPIGLSTVIRKANEGIFPGNSHTTMPKAHKKRTLAIDALTEDHQNTDKRLPQVKVVGISGSGKSTLVRALRAAGYEAKPVSQEHSGVPTLWKEMGVPRVLIYLDVSLAAQQARRQDVPWSEEARTVEVNRLADARANADLRIDTSGQAPHEVCAIALAWLKAQRIRHARAALPALGETGAPIAPAKPQTKTRT